MAGVVAPKDPEKKRPYFYIMRDKTVFGAKQPNGKGVTFIYEDGGRLINSAKIVGNIEDEEILTLLRTTEGAKKLIHSVGVSIETENPDENVDFIFQMYGKNDIYGGGTNVKASLKGNGAETRIYFADQTWSEDDNIPGQIRFEFETPEKLSKVNVRFFLNDGFTAPEDIAETAVDFDSVAYKAMIERSLVSLGDTTRLLNAVKKAESGEKMTVAYIGGSITQGAGATPISTESYAYQSYKQFAEKYGKAGNINFIKAGVGGTPSELGMLRFERDVLRGGNGLSAIDANGLNTEYALPDIIVIEFAVNDEGDETKGKCYESLAKKALKLPNKPAVIMLFSVFADDYNLQDRLSPVIERYNLPMVSLKNAVSPEFKKADRVLSKNQYFYDVFHPTNIGHRIMADSIMNLIDKAVEKKTFDGASTDSLMEGTPVIGDEFTDVVLLDKADTYDKATITEHGFKFTDTELQCVEMDDSLKFTPEFPFNWMYDGTKENSEPFIEIDICAKAFLVINKDSGAVDAGKADIFVDGEFVRTIDPHLNGWTHCNPLIAFNEKEAKMRKVCVKMHPGDENKKFTILGFGYVL